MPRRSVRTSAWWKENRPTRPVNPHEVAAEEADIDAIWRWIRGYLRESLGCRYRPVTEPDLPVELRERWRRNLTQLAEIGRMSGALHPVDPEACARFVREILRHDLGHRRRAWRRPDAVTELHSDHLFGLANSTVVVLGERRPEREGGLELLAVRAARRQEQARSSTAT